MKKRIKKTEIEKYSLTFRLLYYWGKCLGINPLTLSKNNKLEFSYFSLFFGCSLGTIYSYIFYRALTERFKYFVPGETPIAIITNFIGICCQFLETSLTWFLFALYQNRINCLVKSFAKAVKISTKLGIPYDYDKNLRKFGISVTFNNVLYLASLAFSNTMLHYFSKYNVSLWLTFNLPRIVSFNMGMLFVCSLLDVKQKFRRLNEKVKFLMSNDYPIASETNKQRFLGLLRNSSCNPDILSDRIFMVAELHRQLRDVLYRIVEHFTPLIYFSIGNYLVSLPTAVYVIYQSLKDLEWISGTSMIFHVGCLSHWIFYPVVVLIIISTVCGSTSEEANNTGNELHAMLSNCKTINDTREFAKFHILSLDLLQNQVSISLFGLFELNNLFFYSNMATATAYLTIMLQFYN